MEEMIREFLIEDALIIVPVLLFLGYLFKNTPKFKDWLIPYLLLVIGIALTLALLGFTVDNLIQGILVTGTAVLGNQLYRQTQKKNV